MKRLLLSFITIFILINLKTKAQLYFPPITGTTWDTLSASSQGWCTGTALDSLYNFLDTTNSKGFIVLKDGKIVLEKYFGTFTKDSNWYWASAGKTLVAATIGIAQEQGLLNINNKTSTYLGSGWTSLSTQQEDSITLWHQLTMTTGLDENVPNDNCTLDTCLKYLAPVGSRWSYHNGPYRLLQDVIDSVYTAGSFNAYLNAKIRNVIGMNGIFINDVNYSTTRSAARFGLLLLAKGKWGNTTVIADTNYLNAMSNTSQSLNKSYGYLTWLNGKTELMVPKSQVVYPVSLAPDAPADMYAAIGKDGQIINVVPSKNLILVRLGAPPPMNSLVPFLYNNDIWKYFNKVACNNPANIFSNTKDDNIVIYPNPSNTNFSIQSNSVIKKIEVLNAQGALIYTTNNILVNTNNFSNGIYYLKITTAENFIVHRTVTITH
jgi:CubicO group peptidase (beta-lactamase class C family)